MLPLPETPLSREQESTLLALLSPGECDRHARFARQSDRDAYLCSHALLQKVVRGATARPECRFSIDKNGKPYLFPPHEQALWFNISHTDGFAACALATSAVGVDVEIIDAERDWRSIARRFFSPAELAYLGLLQNKEAYCKFFEIWTLKEAVGKAAGLGILLPLDRFAIEPALPFPKMVTDLSILDGKWWMRSIRLGSHKGAIALRTSAPESVIFSQVMCNLDMFF